jgi:undecaprenyl diphosphate synthase
VAYAHKNKIRLTVVGQMERLPVSLQALVKQAEAETRAYEAMTVCLALSYGGRDDIVNAARTLAAKAATGEIQPQDIDESLFEAQLSTHRKGISHPPDLVIRTSGERRWSNFMLFECAYSEFFVSDVLWPDFKEGDLLAALESYGQRNRRFGGVIVGEVDAGVGVEEASSLIA